MDASIFLYTCNISLTFILCMVHFFFTKKDYPANRMLSLFLFCIFYVSIMLVLFASKAILIVPHFYRTGNIFIYMMFPAAYLYTRKILRQEDWRRMDLLHLIPAILYIIDFVPFFALSTAQKINILHEDYAAGKLYAFHQTWIFPAYFHFYFRGILAYVYLFLMGKLWVKYFFVDSDFRKENKSLMQWLAVLTLLLAIESAPSMIIMIFRIPINLIKASNILSYGITTCFTLFLIFKPEIVYGVKGLWVKRPEPDNDLRPQTDMIVHPEVLEGEEEDAEVNKKVYLKEELVERIGEAIEAAVMERKTYLNKGYSLADLSSDTGYPTHQLSAFLNKHLGMNFNEYVNDHRIKYLLTMFAKDDNWQRFTLQALGEQVGFSNRFSFLSAFKKVTGDTPSGYLKGKGKFVGSMS